MTPKERVLMAVAHEEPDRVPTGEWQFGREIVEPILGKGTLCDQWATKHALWQGREKRDAVNGVTIGYKYVDHAGARCRGCIPGTQPQC